MEATKFVGSVALEDLWSAAHLLAAGQRNLATFELWARRLPPGAGFLLVAGLHSFLETIKSFSLSSWLSEEELRSLLCGAVSEETVAQLLELKFQGDVDAIPEGTVVFAREPVLRLRCEAATGILLASCARSIFSAASSVATRMAMLCRSAGGRPVFDVGLRSAAGAPEAAQLARAAFIGGAAASHSASSALRGGLASATPISLRWIRHFGDQDEVRARLMSLSRLAALRIDTDDPEDGLRDLVQLGVPVRDVLLDCGDLDEASRKARRILDDAGWNRTRVFVGGDLRPSDLAAFASTDAPIDGFFVGESVDSADELVAVRFEYQVVEWQQEGVFRPYGRTTPGRVVDPGAKMVFRRRDRGQCIGDFVQRIDQPPPPAAVPLLVPLCRKGGRFAGSPSLGEIKALAQAQLQHFQREVLEGAVSYPVTWVEPAPAEPIKGEDLEFLEEHKGIATEKLSTPRNAAPSAAELLQQVDDSSDFSSFTSVFDSLVAERIQEHLSSNEVEDASQESPPSAEAPMLSLEEVKPEPTAEATATGEPKSTPEPLANSGQAPAPLSSTPNSAAPVDAGSPKSPPSIAPVVPMEKVAAVGVPPVSGPAEPLSGVDDVVRRDATGWVAVAEALKRARSGGTQLTAPDASTKSTDTSTSNISTTDVVSRRGADPLLAAAARLRKVKSAEESTPSATSADSRSASGNSAPAKTPVSVDPLQAAARRLKALQGGDAAPGNSGAVSDDSADAELAARAKQHEEERVTRSKADPLLGAAGRLKALRSKS